MKALEASSLPPQLECWKTGMMENTGIFVEIPRWYIIPGKVALRCLKSFSTILRFVIYPSMKRSKASFTSAISTLVL